MRLDIQNKVIQDLERSKNPTKRRLVELKGKLETKILGVTRDSSLKNAINNSSVLNYMMIPLSNSTESLDGNDYIAPIVKTNVDYSEAAITKGLMPNGVLKLEFVAQDTEDEVAARQATNMVSYLLNSQLGLHSTIADWVKDGALNKNGMMVIRPIREIRSSYKDIQGKADELTAFERQIEESGGTFLLQSRKKVSVDLEQVRKEMASMSQSASQELNDEMLANHMRSIADDDEFSPEDIDEQHLADDGIINQNLDEQETLLQESLERNTIYAAQYKISGYTLNIKLQAVKQAYWFCDSFINNVQEQDFCGFYERMTVQRIAEQYPGVDIEKVRECGDYSPLADRGGYTQYELSIHARDTSQYGGIASSPDESSDENSKTLAVVTAWYRYDIDGDGEFELIEIICTGSYIISAKEVEFIPIASMCPMRIPTDFYGMSIAESVISQQEYATGAARAQIDLGYQMATPRIGVNSAKVDIESIQDGNKNIFLIHSDFDPVRDIYPIPGPTGNLTYLAEAIQTIRNDAMALTGMVTPNDTFAPEVMADGNSGVKLQIALTPHQLSLDHKIRNCAEGLKDAIYLIWRTLIQYSDDFGVKRLARKHHPNKEDVFLDAVNFDDMNFYERKEIHLELAIGMMSSENAIQRDQIAKVNTSQFWQGLMGLIKEGLITESLFKKLRKPFEKTLYNLAEKNPDEFLPTWADVLEIQQKMAQAAQASGQDPDSQETMSKIQLNNAKAMKLENDVATEKDRLALEAIALKSGKAQNY